MKLWLDMTGSKNMWHPDKTHLTRAAQLRKARMRIESMQTRVHRLTDETDRLRRTIKGMETAVLNVAHGGMGKRAVERNLDRLMKEVEKAVLERVHVSVEPRDLDRLVVYRLDLPPISVCYSLDERELELEIARTIT